MIKLRVRLSEAIDEIGELIEATNDFMDCRFEKMEFKTWKEDVCSFLNRTYCGAELYDKMDKFNSICFISAGWDSYCPSLEHIDADDSGLGGARALLMAWKNDLCKRREEHMMDKLSRAVIVVLSLGMAGGIAYGIYVKISNHKLVNNGRVENVNSGDNPVQNNYMINANGDCIEINNESPMAEKE